MVPALLKRFITAELVRTCTVVRSNPLQVAAAAFKWLENEGEPASAAGMRASTIPKKPLPILLDEDARRLIVSCTARISATDGTSRSSGSSSTPVCGPEEWAVCGTAQRTPRCPTWTRVVRITAKDRREMVLPIGTKSAGTLTGTCPRAAHPPAADRWLWLGKRDRMTPTGAAGPSRTLGRPARDYSA